MEHQDEEVATEEPQLRYWNPWRRGRSVFTASSLPVTSVINPLHLIKMCHQAPNFCDQRISCMPSSLYENQQSISQDILFQNGFQSTSEVTNANLSPTTNETTVTELSTLITLDRVSSQSPPFEVPNHDEVLKPSIKLEPEEEFEKFGQEFRNEIVTFNSIDEALDSIDPPSTPDSNRSSVSINSSLQGNNNKMGLSNEKHEEVVKAAKSLFSKRTRTLYHWLFPDTSKNKLKATVSAAWDTLSEGEKHFYISQVLGRFGLQASSLMVNPQLGGMKYLPTESENKSDKKKSIPIEDQRAVDSLFDSCEDAGNWASYSEPKQTISGTVQTNDERKSKRKRQKVRKEQDTSTQVDRKIRNMKKLKKVVHKDLRDFEEDPELREELEKFRLITEAAEEDIWGDIPDPDELFAEIDF